MEEYGVAKTARIAKIVIHPKNDKIVYTFGPHFGPQEDRGIYKTTNGGKTWEKIFYRSKYWWHRYCLR